MKLTCTLALLAVLYGGAQAQQSPKPTDAPTKPADAPPVITDAQRAAFFKAQLRAQATAQAAQEAQQAIQGVLNELSKACGASYRPEMSPQGDPVCVKAEVKK